MSACIVCDREAVCDVCEGTGLELYAQGMGGLGTGPCTMCFREKGGEVFGTGITHAHPRKERKRARQYAVDALPAQGRKERRAVKDPVADRWFSKKRMPWDGRYSFREFVVGWHRDVLAHLRDRTMRDALDAQDGVQ